MMDDLLLVVFFVERDETVDTVDDCIRSSLRWAGKSLAGLQGDLPLGS